MDALNKFRIGEKARFIYSIAQEGYFFDKKLAFQKVKSVAKTMHSAENAGDVNQVLACGALRVDQDIIDIRKHYQGLKGLRPENTSSDKQTDG